MQADFESWTRWNSTVFFFSSGIELNKLFIIKIMTFFVFHFAQSGKVKGV